MTEDGRVVGPERRRDGATRWGVFEDVEQEGRWVETFMLASWADLRLLRQRVTRADQENERRIEAMLEEPRSVGFHVAPPGTMHVAPTDAAPIQAVLHLLRRRSNRT